MNPCPCGYFGDTQRECRCTPLQIQRYRTKISGPLLDRIDIHVEVPSVRYQELASLAQGEPSCAIRERVVSARKIQQQRFGGNGRIHCNADMGSKELQRQVKVEQDAQEMLKMAITELSFSARAYDRILKVSRTIADLEASDTIQSHHVSEAIQYRSLDREMW
jgi:magnesium chelatase family protein